jgi:hypothetical protein
MTVDRESQAIGEFLDWINNKKGYFVARHLNTSLEGRLALVSESADELVAEFLGVDLAAIEAESRAILARLRKR